MMYRSRELPLISRWGCRSLRDKLHLTNMCDIHMDAAGFLESFQSLQNGIPTERSGRLEQKLESRTFSVYLICIILN